MSMWLCVLVLMISLALSEFYASTISSAVTSKYFECDLVKSYKDNHSESKYDVKCIMIKIKFSSNTSCSACVCV